VKPQATTSTGGAGKFYLIEAVVAYGKREIVTGVGWRNLSCTLTHYTTAYANSQADLEKDRLGLGESVLGIVKNTSGALNPRLVSSRVVSGPSASQIKAPGHRIDCN
jgi:hypothetical protein